MFSFSGRIAEGASDALDKVLERRMREQLREQQEQQHQDQIKLQTQQMEQQAKRDAAVDRARIEDLKYREGQQADSRAAALHSMMKPGQASPAQAATLRKSEVFAPMVTDRQVIDARPISAPSVLPGSVSPEPSDETGPRLIGGLGPRGPVLGGSVQATTDASGPQNFSVLEPTAEQAETAGRQTKLVDLVKRINSAGGGEAERRHIAAEGLPQGINVPESYLGATDTEQAATRARTLAEERAYGEKEWSRREGITTANAEAREARAEERAINKALRAAAPDPKTQAEQRAATIEAARSLLSAPGLSKMTGARGREYLFGLRDEPLAGSEARDAKEFFSTLQSLLALPKLSYLKGPMSDKDIEFVKAAASSLKPEMKDETFRKTLTDILFRLENPTGDNSAFAPASGHDGFRPATSHTPTTKPDAAALWKKYGGG